MTMTHLGRVHYAILHSYIVTVLTKAGPVGSGCIACTQPDHAIAGHCALQYVTKMEICLG